MSFPASPSNGQSAVVNNITYSYSTTTNSWSRVAVIASGSVTTGTYTINNATSATSTSSGALQVLGGVGIGGSVYAGGSLYAGNIYTNGNQILPTSIQEFTATAGQTTFAISGGYQVGQVQVLVNGIGLNSSDYTASNGSTIVLAIPRNVNDIVRTVVSQLASVSTQQAYNFTQISASSAGQNTFSAIYNTATVQVFLSGSLVPPSNYTASNGTTIILNSATAATVLLSSVVAVVSFNSVSITNAISSSGGTINGTLNINGAVNVVGTLNNNGVNMQALSIAMSTALGI